MVCINGRLVWREINCRRLTLNRVVNLSDIDSRDCFEYECDFMKLSFIGTTENLIKNVNNLDNIE